MPKTVVTFYAADLLSKWGFDDGDVPDAVSDHLWERSMADSISRLRAWHPNALIPVVRDLLIPALPVPVQYETYEATSHNPIRATRVGNRRPTLRQPVQDDKPLLGDCHVTLPVPFLTDLALGMERLAGLTEIPLAVLNAAVTAGLSVPEIRSAHSDGTLTLDAARTLTALQGSRHA